jgi:purine-binding chemotaxis protein CheW
MQSAAQISQADLRELVTFKVGEQDYCIDIMSVREIRGWTPATVLPYAPSYVLGVINLRGTIVPIVDLSARLNLGRSEPDSRHVVVITAINNQMVGLLVNSVSDIMSVNRSAVQPVPEAASEATGAHIEGVIAIDDRMLRVIDLQVVIPSIGEREIG